MLLVFFETLKMRNVQQIKVVGSHIWTGWFKSLILSSNTFIIIKSISSKSKKNKENSNSIYTFRLILYFCKMKNDAKRNTTNAESLLPQMALKEKTIIM